MRVISTILGNNSIFRCMLLPANQDENTRAMVYFLHHATSLSMQLPVWIARFEQERMVRFIDIPIESCGRSSPLRVALQASAPDLLLILLRYGAHPTPPDGGASVVHALLEKLTENGRNYVLQNVSCLQILLRTIPMIEMPYKPIIYSARRELFFEKYGRLLIDRIITKEQVYGVVSLRHLCRCRIRDLLRRNCQLPDGIDTLRLPRRLHRYIDLMEELEGPQKEDDDENNAALEKLQATGGAVSGARKRVHFAESKEEEQSSVDVEVAVEVVESLLLEERLPMEQQATMTGDLPTVVEEDTTELAEEQLEMESQNDFAVVVEKPLAVEISTDSDISSNEKAEQDSCICNNKKNGSNTLGKVRECIERQLS
uniref:SOCS box domain-containing protein n=1 Tax=Bactrocera latifrons TaxID=174628 RepID=A0A0K8UZX0_BACLA